MVDWWTVEYRVTARLEEDGPGYKKSKPVPPPYRAPPLPPIPYRGALLPHPPYSV